MQATQTIPPKSAVPNVAMFASLECRVSWELLHGSGVYYWRLLGALDLVVYVYSLVEIRFIIVRDADILWVKNMSKLVDIFLFCIFPESQFKSQSQNKRITLFILVWLFSKNT